MGTFWEKAYQYKVIKIDKFSYHLEKILNILHKQNYNKNAKMGGGGREWPYWKTGELQDSSSIFQNNKINPKSLVQIGLSVPISKGYRSLFCIQKADHNSFLLMKAL